VVDASSERAADVAVEDGEIAAVEAGAGADIDQTVVPVGFGDDISSLLDMK
jgi:hypothetical protein